MPNYASGSEIIWWPDIRRNRQGQKLFLEGLDIPFWIVVLARVLIVNDGKCYVAIACRELLRNNFTKQFCHMHGRILVVAAAKSRQHNSIMTVLQSNVEDRFNLLLGHLGRLGGGRRFRDGWHIGKKLVVRSARRDRDSTYSEGRRG